MMAPHLAPQRYGMLGPDSSPCCQRGYGYGYGRAGLADVFESGVTAGAVPGRMDFVSQAAAAAHPVRLPVWRSSVQVPRNAVSDTDSATRILVSVLA